MRRRRFRLRTWLRGHAPWFMANGVLRRPKRSCGYHEWYQVDKYIDACLHCLSGVRGHRSIRRHPRGDE
jgi:hypothetical protein